MFLGEFLIIKGYLLIVFFEFLYFLECVGPGCEGEGDIMVIYMVLVDGDDMNELIVDVI